MKYLPLFLLPLILLTACQSHTRSNQPITRPAFSSDSAYAFIQRQVDMGPRVPGTHAHTECLLYLMEKMTEYGAVVECQHGMMTDYQGEQQQVVNIIAHFGNPEAKGRILLAAHYDTRPWADEEEEYSQRFSPIPGANDGASGVGVLLEVARQIHISGDSLLLAKPIDIVFFDCEDKGTPSFYTGQERENTWCLGAQLWAEQMSGSRQQKKFLCGVLLDMVGATDATFPKEYTSVKYAHNYVEKMWHLANQLGHSRYFTSEKDMPIIDDHYYVNTLADIPCLDVIHYNHVSGSGFPRWWHTQEDDMQNISGETLQAVGEVVMAFIR